MDRTIDLIEENLNNTQNIDPNVDVKAAVNDLVDGMKNMLGMIKISLQNSAPSNVLQNLEPFIKSAVQNACSEDLRNKEKKIEALQKIIMNNEQKLEESELYSTHLERRIALLEDCNRQIEEAERNENNRHTEDLPAVTPLLEDILIEHLSPDSNNPPDDDTSDTGSVSP